MTKRTYSILQKKLQELESQLTEAFSLPPDTPYRHFYSQEIEQKFVFLNNLLSAEIASSPKKPYNLHHIAQRVADLEVEFREWDRDNVAKDSTLVDTFETGSTCSHHNNEHYHVDAHDDKDDVEEKFVEESSGQQENVKSEERRVLVGKYLAVLCCGIVLGMALMCLVVVRFTGCFGYVKHNRSLLTPT